MPLGALSRAVAPSRAANPGPGQLAAGSVRRGAGEIGLTLSQLMARTGAVVVCTPQGVALLDAVKAIAMFRKVNIPVLGIVENMSGFVCPHCRKRTDIFPGVGGEQIAEVGPVSITVLDVRGRAVRQLVRGRHEPGYHEVVWDGADDAGTAALERRITELTRELEQAKQELEAAREGAATAIMEPMEAEPYTDAEPALVVADEPPSDKIKIGPVTIGGAMRVNYVRGSYPGGGRGSSVPEGWPCSPG